MSAASSASGHSQRHGVARRQLRSRRSTRRTAARGLGRRALPSTTRSFTRRSRMRRRLPHQRRRAELCDGRSLRAAVSLPRRRADDGQARQSAFAFTNDLQRITDIVVQSGSNLQNVNLPIEPNGVVYNTLSRAAVAGATLTLSEREQQTALPAAASTIRPAESGHAGVRLLQVRSELRRSGLPERRQLSSSKSTPPSTSYIAGPSADHSAGVDRRDGAVLGARRARRAPTTPCRRPRSTAKCSSPSCSRRRSVRARARVRAITCTSRSTDEPRAGLERRSSTITFRSIRICRVCCRHHEDDADAQRHARPDGAVHDHVHERESRVPSLRRRGRRPLPRGLPLHRGLGAHRRRAARAVARRAASSCGTSLERRRRTGAIRSCCCSRSAPA